MNALLMAPVASKLRQRWPRPCLDICGTFPGYRDDLFGAGTIAAAAACTNTNPNAEPDTSPVADSQYG